MPRPTTWFQRIALIFLLAAGLYWVAAVLTGIGRDTGTLILACFLTLLAFRKPLLWRVRNRLLLTFFLFGIVPLFLICTMLFLATWMIVGQFAGDRVRHDLDARVASVHAIAQDLALAASHNAAPALLSDLSSREPRLGAIVLAQGAPVFSKGTAFSAAPTWLEPAFQGLFEDKDNYYIGANTSLGSVTAFAWLPLDKETLATISGDAVDIAGLISSGKNTTIGFGPDGGRIAVRGDGGLDPVIDPRLPPAKNAWDISAATLLNFKLRTAKTADATVYFPLFARPSRLLSGVFTGRMASVVVSLIIIVGSILLLVEMVSLIASALHTRTITRSVDDIYRGTLQIAGGNFAHEIPVRGDHQLSALATSFNDMTGRIRHYVVEMRKKEKLESELEIAKQVQARLFPRSIPQLRTLELAAVCLPGRVVSGDYYDFVRLDDRFTAIALGDVSGKGVSAALLMASIQSSLHAQLKFRGDAMLSPSFVAVLMKLVSQQLYENTPPEKYATFFCSVYDDESGILRYANCGHLKPILVRAGKATLVEGDGMPVGLLPGTSYEQFELELQSDDLVAIYSDGVPEAENASEEEFGEERLSGLLVKHAAAPLDKIIQSVTKAVDEWSADPEARDDTTIVLLRRF